MTLYAAPVVGTTLVLAPLGTVVTGLYAKSTGLTLTTIALITLVARLGDAFSDPLIGHWSDRIRARGGSRRPMIALGAFLVVLSSCLLATPPANNVAIWFSVWTVAVFLGWSLFDIPHNAWGTELALGYAERTRLFSFRITAFYVGSIIFYLIPLTGLLGSSEFNFSTLKWAAGIAAAYVCVTVALLWRLPDPTPMPVANKVSLTDMFRSVAANRPLLLFLAAYFLSGFGFGMYGSILFLFVDGYLGLGQSIAMVFALSSPVAMFSIPVWYRITARIGKRNTWLTSTVAMVAMLALAGFLTPGPLALTGIIACSMGLFLFAACQGVVAPAILADIVDYGRWKFRQDRAATYYAALSIVAKAIVAVGGAAAFAVAGAFGYDAAAKVVSHSAATGLKLAVAWLPALFVASSLPLIWLTPITPQRLAALQKRLQRRAEQAR